MTWRLAEEVLQPNMRRCRVLGATPAQYLSFEHVADLLQYDPRFQTWLSDRLRTVPWAAYFWETPPVSKATLKRDFEYVVIDAPSLAIRPASAAPFIPYFKKAEGEVVTFRNIGRDALLVVPVPTDPKDDYAHLASFLRTAPQRQINALWQLTFAALCGMLGESAVWVSTSGLGVAWAHVRLDSWPKYYNYAPYKKTC